MRLRLWLSLAPALGLFAFSLMGTGAKAQSGTDFPVPGGWYFTQATVRSGLGYSVVDDALAPMWTEYRRLGGTEALGYPVSRRYFGPDGMLYQGFERFVLQWRPDLQRVVIANIYEQFSEAGLDDFLLANGIPRPEPAAEASFLDDSRRRMGWLTESRLLGFYLLNPLTQEPWELYEQAWDIYGLPQTGPERLRVVSDGFALWPFIVQRFQKGTLQLWLENGPAGITAGSVSIVTGGTLARQASLIPITAAIPEPPPSSLPYLIGQPQLSGTTVELAGQTLRHFAIAGAGFSPGEPVTLSLVRQSAGAAPAAPVAGTAPTATPVPAATPGVTAVATPTTFVLTLSTLARADGTFIVEGDTLPGTYAITARGRISGVSVSDSLVLS